jgi:phytoene dehydrogenase-like protein
LIDYVILRPPPTLSELLSELRRLRFTLGFGLERLESFIEESLYALTTSAGRMLDDYFESDEIKAALVEDGVVGVFAGPYTPGTAYVLAHHAMGEVNGVKGAWGYVEGGMGALSNALARRAGVDLLMGTPVTRIVADEGGVKGVVLGDGRFVESRVVVSNADIKTTFLKLLDQDAVDKSLRRRIMSLRTSGVSAKLIGVIRELPRYAVRDADPLLGNWASTLIMPSVDYVEAANRDALNGGFSRRPWISVNIPTTYDPTITKPPYHVFSMFIQYTPRDLDWGELKERLREVVYETVEEYAPGFRRLIIHDMVLTPMDIEERFGSIGGNIFHVDMLPDQVLTNRPLPGLSRYRTPIRGLYLCGADTHPGGGVTGAPGHNAAMEILRDLGRIKESPKPRLTEILRTILKLISSPP